MFRKRFFFLFSRLYSISVGKVVSTYVDNVVVVVFTFDFINFFLVFLDDVVVYVDLVVVFVCFLSLLSLLFFFIQP